MSKHSSGSNFSSLFVTHFESIYPNITRDLDARIVQQLEYIEFNLGVSLANERYSMLKEFECEIMYDTWSSANYYRLASILLTTSSWLRKGEYSRQDLDMLISHR